MRVLVTGAEGFTGRYVAAALRKKGHEPVPLAADITDSKAISLSLNSIRPNAVVHLAAKAFVNSSDFESFYKVNQIGTFNLLHSLSSYSPGIPIIIASTSNIYGATESTLLSEDAVPNPLGHYALSKWAMELGSKFWTERLQITIVRPFNYTGVGQEGIYLVPKIVDHVVKKALRIELGNLDAARDIGDVRDVAEAYCALIERKSSFGVLNICTGRGVTARQVLEIACKYSKYSPDIGVDPGLLRKNEIPYLVGNNLRIRQLLPDWNPRPIEETISWMLGSGDSFLAGV